MPDFLRIGPYRFFSYSMENGEPPHVHVSRDRNEVKFWLEPAVSLARSHGFAEHEINRVRKLVETHRALLLEKWHEHFDDDNTEWA